MLLQRSILLPALGVALSAAGVVLTLHAIPGITRTAVGWVVLLAGLAALVVHGLLFRPRTEEPAADAKLAVLVAALALPAGATLLFYSGVTPSVGTSELSLLFSLGLLGNHAAADAASDGLFTGGIILLLGFGWTRWPRLAFAAALEGVLGLIQRFIPGGDSWSHGLALLVAGAILTAAAVALHARRDEVAGSLAMPAGIAALAGVIFLPIADPSRLALGSVLVSALLVVWLVALVVLAPRIGAGVVATAATLQLGSDLASGSHLWLAVPILCAGVLLILLPLVSQGLLRA